MWMLTAWAWILIALNDMFYHGESDINIQNHRRKVNKIINTFSDYTDGTLGNWSTEKYVAILNKILNVTLQHS